VTAYLRHSASSTTHTHITCNKPIGRINHRPQEKPRYFHFNVYVSFLFGSRSFNGKPLLNYKFATKRRGEILVGTLFDFCGRGAHPLDSPAPAFIVIVERLWEMILKKTTRSRLEHYFFHGFFFILLFCLLG